MKGKHRLIFNFSILGLLSLAHAFGASAAAERIGAESVLPLENQMRFTVVVNRAPADNAAVRVNPPRFRWTYVPDVRRLTPSTRALYRFRFQISADPDFRSLLLDVETESNAYNELAPLAEGKTYYWRVGYLCQMACLDGAKITVPREKEPSVWSPVRRFAIKAGTPKWDRSMLRKPDFGAHPRLVFRKQQLAQLRRIVTSDPVAKQSFAGDVLKPADEMIRHPYWKKPWPETDKGKEIKGYYKIGRKLTRTAFAYMVTGDKKYRHVKDLFLKIASYPRGGRSSPESMGGDQSKKSTSLTEYLALAYDWFYDEYTPAERKIFEKSLEWRIAAWMNEGIAWAGVWQRRFKHGPYDGPAVDVTCLPLFGVDHNWEGAMTTFPAALVLYEKSKVARRYFHLMSNFLIGVGERPAQTGCPDQGLSYGLSHMKWMMYDTLYLVSALPAAKWQRNPYYRQIAGYFLATAPTGMPHAPWGRNDEGGAFREHFKEVFYLLAHLAQSSVALDAWRQSGGKGDFWWRPWASIAAPLHFPKPLKPQSGKQRDFLFPGGGWAAFHALPPSARNAFLQGAGMILASRPSMGRLDNVFFNNNAVQLYAYGECINFGGGPGSEQPQHFHTMAHNTLLVDGIGQMWGGPNAFKVPVRGGVLAYRKEKNYVYGMAEATKWYPKVPYRQKGARTCRIDPEGKVYGKRAVPYLRTFRRHVLFMRRKYFVIFDRLETAPDHPARFTWLYHVLRPAHPKYDAARRRLEYACGKVRVLLQHIAGKGGLAFEDRKGFVGWRNPMTGEDLTRNKYVRETLKKSGAKSLVAAHNFWFSNKAPQSRFHFLAVVYPVKPGAEKPKIERLDNYTFRVENGGERDVISFDPRTRHPATLVVDPEAIGKAARLAQ